jgi:hypothetical protein
MKGWVGTFEDLEVEIEEFRDLGNGVTYGVLSSRGRPKGSSGLVEQLHYVGVGLWADGLV